MLRGIFSLGFALAIFAGCSKSQPPAPPSVARIFHQNGAQKVMVDSITVFEYRRELARARLEREGNLQAAALPSALKQAILEQLIDARILIWKAKEMKVKVSTSAVSKQIAIMQRELGERELRKNLLETYQRPEDLEASVRERLIIGKLMQAAAHKDVNVSEKELKEAWARIPAKDKKVPKLVRARQIVVQTEEEATELHLLLRRGHDFSTLAAQRSISPEGQRGGDLGWFEQGSLPKVFDETCFSLRLGQTSPVTPSEYGFHIFEVTGIEPEHALDFEALKDRIRSKVLHKKLQAAESKFVSQLRKEFAITRDQNTLKGIH